MSCVSRDDASLNDSAMVIITVEPVNEFQPVVTRTPSPFFINELTPPGTVLVSTIPGGIRQYTVTDQDSGPDGVITYTIQSVSPPEFASYFELNRTVGALILNQSFDLDEVQVSLVAVRITACDIDPPVVDCPNFVITILPSLVNDNPPIFSQDIYVETVPESFAVNGVIATVSCSDADHSIGAFSGYVISSVSPERTPPDTFAIDDSSGNITLLQPLDYEFTSVYEINLVCQDMGGMQDNATVVVMVTDTNDNNPFVLTFLDDVIDLNDQSPVATDVFQFQCIDPDSNENGNITFSIESDSSIGSFAIDETTGNITVSASLVLPDDVFIMESNITVQCSDQGNPQLSNSSTLFIEIYKDDSTPPFIDRSSISDGLVSISEGARVGDELVQVLATDTTSPDLQYMLRNESSPGTFEINSTTGVITIAQSLDREDIDMYTFVVVVTEVRVAPGDPVSDEAEVTVEILDINDNFPLFSQDTYTVIQPENLAVGEVITTVSCSDVDTGINGSFSGYKIIGGYPSGTFPDTFAIDSSTGNVTLLLSLDYELSPMYTIDLLCLDNGGLEDNATVVISVTDVNDNSPNIETFFDDVILISDQSQITFSVLQFQCTDRDSDENGNITYSIDGVSSFTIDDITGNVTVSSSLVLPDNVFTMDDSITVQCSDQGDPPLSNSSTIYFQIYKEDSAPPIIDRANISDGLVSISEAASPGTVLTQVLATDTTTPSLLFMLRDESSPGTFEINSTSGVITVAQQLNREAVDMYTFTVVVTEERVAPGDPQSDEVEFTVTVLDTNDNPPSFSQDTYNVTQLESFPVDETIATVSCEDVDIGINGSFSGYEIIDLSPSEAPPDTFSIDDSSGNITLLQPLDYELSSIYVINLRCFDNGGMGDTATVEIRLEDVNDNYPVVVRSFTEPVFVSDDSLLGHDILQFQCTDSDSNENGEVLYSISGTSLFSIDQNTGVVLVMSSLALPSGSFLVDHRITIQCSDQGMPPLSNGSTILLQIYKVDSTVPVIDMSSISNGSLSISEGAQVGEELVQVIATDLTSPGLRYELQDESLPGTFTIDPTSGQISLAEPLDREMVAMYSFKVVVIEIIIGSVTEPASQVSASVNVTIEDINDNKPECRNSNGITKYVLIGNYGSSRSLEIANLTCSDLDSGRNGEITFSAENKPTLTDGRFILNATTGELSFTGVLSQNATYPIIIKASDRGNPPLSTLVNISLIVTGERREEFTRLERLLLIIVPSVSGGLLLCACLLILCMCCCCCCCRRREPTKKSL